MTTHYPSIELLEARIAPAALATFTDVDGDTVKVTSSIGTSAHLAAALHVTGGQLTEIDLSAATWGTEFANAKLSISVSALGANGNGAVNVGYLNAAGTRLGDVGIHGDLGRIVAGATSSTLGVKSLTVSSMGTLGLTTGATTLASAITGGTALLHVTGDISEASLDFSGRLGALTVGGSIFGGAADNTGRIVAVSAGNLHLGGSLLAGDGLNSAQIAVTSTTPAGAITIGGSIFGRLANSGQVLTHGAASFSLGGAIVGGTAANAGAISLGDVRGAVTIHGPILGGGAQNAGSLFLGKAGAIRIDGSIEGGAASGAGLLNVTGGAASITVTGSLVGRGGPNSGSVFATSVNAIVIGGSVTGGSASGAGSLIFGASPNVSIVGSVGGGSAANAGSVLFNAALNVKIGGYLTGGTNGAGVINAVYFVDTLSIADGVSNATIVINNKIDPAVAIAPLVARKISIGGSISGSRIVVGNLANPDVQVGAVTVGGDWIASSLVVGANNLGSDDAAGGTGPAADNSSFGDAHDRLNAGGSTSILAKIASITIGGNVRGSSAAGDHFGFVAEQIGSFRAGGVLFPLAPGAHTDNRTIGDDVTIHEV